jgi:hypothetical protein
MELTFASMFAGVEAPRLALEPLGWKYKLIYLYRYMWV